MYIENPYEKKYFPISILQGIQFYYTLLDKVNIEIYFEEKFPIKRVDVELVIKFLSNLPKEALINNITFSSPSIEYSMESVESFTTLSIEKSKLRKNQISIFLFNLLDTGINLMVLHYKYDEIPTAISELPIDQKIKFLINLKFHFSQSLGSYPTKFIKEMTLFCDSLISQYKEIQIIESPNIINEHLTKIAKQSLSLIETHISNNDLISPLTEVNFDLFVDRLKSMLFIPSYFDITKDDKERSFHIYLLGVLEGKITGYTISSNKESGIGRYDIALTPIDHTNPAVIIELKKIETKADIDFELTEALNQIQNQHYNIDFKTLGIKTILNIVIIFNGLEPNIRYKID